MAGRGTDYSAGEMGFPPPPPPPPGDLPPGGGGASTPHFLSFAGLVQTAARTYRYTFDEAIRDNRANALAMRRDCVLWAALRARQMPTSQLSWDLSARDETDPAEVEAAKLVTEVIESIPRFQVMKMLLLEALWFGKYATEVVYGWETWRGRQVLTVQGFYPINGDKIRFKWDGTPGVLVNGTYPGSWEATDWGMAHFVTPEEREQYVIHEHEPDDADWTEGEMAGAVHGVGLRGRLYWFWWLKQQVFGLLMNYLERFSNGVTVFYYNAHNPEAQAAAAAAAQQQFSNTALLYPRWVSENPDTNKIERLEVGTASPALLQSLVETYFDDVMTRAILGQTLSSSAQATGLGSGVAELHGETLDEIIKYDAVNLEETLQRDLVNVLYRYNAPGVRPGKFKFSVDTPNAEAVLGYAGQLYQMGMALDEDQLYDVSQLTKPKPGGGIVSQIGQMAPAAVQIPAQGVPTAQPAGAPPGQMPPDAAGALAYRRNGVHKNLQRRKVTLGRR
jgi:phage gp29-like protein